MDILTSDYLQRVSSKVAAGGETTVASPEAFQPCFQPCYSAALDRAKFRFEFQHFSFETLLRRCGVGTAGTGAVIGAVIAVLQRQPLLSHASGMGASCAVAMTSFGGMLPATASVRACRLCKPSTAWASISSAGIAAHVAHETYTRKLSSAQPPG